MSVADDIKSRLDIVDYVQRFVPLKRAGRTYKAPCPFHSERTPSFVVNPDRQSWRCFGSCAEGGDVIKFAQKLHGWSFTEALQELGKLTGVEIKPRTQEQQAQDEAQDVLRGLMATAADSYHNALLDTTVEKQAEVLRYTLEKRGLNRETITAFKIGYAPPGWSNMLDHLKTLGYSEAQMLETGLAIQNEDSGRVYDRFRNRLIIPIRDERGRVIGFGARALDPDDNPKYLNSPQTALFDKSRTLFAYDAAKGNIRETEVAVIVEGYMDAIQAHQAGFKNVVAQMGTAMTEPQLRQLTRSAKRIVLALDSDAAGQNATRRSLETARATLESDWAGRMAVDIRVLHIPGAKDPDDLIRESPERWATLVTEAMPVADFVIDLETQTLPADASVQQREQIARNLLPLLSASENNLYNHDNIQKLALRLRIKEQDLLNWAADELKKRPPKVSAPVPKRPTTPLPPAEAPPASATEPSPPPLDYDDQTLPQPEWELPPLPGVTPATLPPSKPVPVESQCLRLLLQEPMTFYSINRKLRELAGDRRDLLNGPLADYCADDFNGTDTRALMQAFVDALEQDELDPLDYLQLRADLSLQDQVQALKADEIHGMKARVRSAHTADLEFVYKQTHRHLEGAAIHHEIIGIALGLRLKRLQREREELSFMQMDAEEEAASAFHHQLALSIEAKRLIESYLKKHSNLHRE
jgi:DNA primase